MGDQDGRFVPGTQAEMSFRDGTYFVLSEDHGTACEGPVVAIWFKEEGAPLAWCIECDIVWPHPSKILSDDEEGIRSIGDLADFDIATREQLRTAGWESNILRQYTRR